MLWIICCQFSNLINEPFLHPTLFFNYIFHDRAKITSQNWGKDYIRSEEMMVGEPNGGKNLRR